MGVTATGPPGSDAVVVNSGDQVHAVLDFTVPGGGDAGPQGDVGPQGAVGAQGATGATGLSGGAYHHDQLVPSAVWAVAHNLGYRPGGIFVADSAGTEVIGDPRHVDENNLTITFSVPFGGTADLS